MHEYVKNSKPVLSKKKDDLETIWNNNFDLIIDSFNQNGHFAYIDKALKVWLSKQIVCYRKNLLYPHRTKKFDNFNLYDNYKETKYINENYLSKTVVSRKKDALDNVWNTNLELVIDSFNKNGHFAYLDESLKAWLSKQITYYEKNLLELLRKNKFDNSGLYCNYKKTKHVGKQYLLKLNTENKSNLTFQNNDTDLLWNQRFNDVVRYFEDNGHFFGMDANLKNWLRERVYEYHRHVMTHQRVEKIDKANLINRYLNTKLINGLWMSKYKALDSFIKSKSFNNNISQNVIYDNLKIGKWIYTQKELLDSSKLCDEIQQLFKRINFDFNWVNDSGRFM